MVFDRIIALLVDYWQALVPLIQFFAIADAADLQYYHMFIYITLPLPHHSSLQAVRRFKRLFNSFSRVMHVLLSFFYSLNVFEIEQQKELLQPSRGFLGQVALSCFAFSFLEHCLLKHIKMQVKDSIY